MSDNKQLLNKNVVTEMIRGLINNHGVSVCAIAGTAMVMHGIRPGANDIDLVVPTADYEKLKSTNKFKEKTVTSSIGSNRVLYDSLFEIFDDITLIGSYTEYEKISANGRMYSFLIQKPESILKFKEILNREKDKADIVLLKKHIRGL